MSPTAYFDLDGCLVESRGPILTSIDAVLDARGLPRVATGEADALMGPPIAAGFRALLLSRGADPSEAVACIAEFRERYAVESLRSTTLVPGIELALRALGARVGLVIVTSKARYLAEPIVRALGLGAYFQRVYGPARTAIDESKSATLARARAEHAGDERDAMIGDRRHDIEAAHACGIRGIGVTWGFGSFAELRESGADVIVEQPSDLDGLFG